MGLLKLYKKGLGGNVQIIEKSTKH